MMSDPHIWYQSGTIPGDRNIASGQVDVVQSWDEHNQKFQLLMCEIKEGIKEAFKEYRETLTENLTKILNKELDRVQSNLDQTRKEMEENQVGENDITIIKQIMTPTKGEEKGKKGQFDENVTKGVISKGVFRGVAEIFVNGGPSDLISSEVGGNWCKVNGGVIIERSTAHLLGYSLGRGESFLSVVGDLSDGAQKFEVASLEHNHGGGTTTIEGDPGFKFAKVEDKEGLDFEFGYAGGFKGGGFKSNGFVGGARVSYGGEGFQFYEIGINGEDKDVVEFVNKRKGKFVFVSNHAITNDVNEAGPHHTLYLKYGKLFTCHFNFLQEFPAITHSIPINSGPISILTQPKFPLLTQTTTQFTKTHYLTSYLSICSLVQAFIFNTDSHTVGLLSHLFKSQLKLPIIQPSSLFLATTNCFVGILSLRVCWNNNHIMLHICGDVLEEMHIFCSVFVNTILVKLLGLHSHLIEKNVALATSTGQEVVMEEHFVLKFYHLDAMRTELFTFSLTTNVIMNANFGPSHLHHKPFNLNVIRVQLGRNSDHILWQLKIFECEAILRSWLCGLVEEEVDYYPP